MMKYIGMTIVVASVAALLSGACMAADDEKDEAVTIDQVPAAVKATILKEAGENKITKIEKEDKDGKVVYEAKCVKDGKTVEIQVAADGKLIATKVEDEKEGKDKKAEDKD